MIQLYHMVNECASSFAANGTGKHSKGNLRELKCKRIMVSRLHVRAFTSSF